MDGSAEPGSSAYAVRREVVLDTGTGANLACFEWLRNQRRIEESGISHVGPLRIWNWPSSDCPTCGEYLYRPSGPVGGFTDVSGGTEFPGPDGRGRPGAPGRTRGLRIFERLGR